jgi:hypothetical protein
MNDKEMFNFYQTHYYHEVEAREKFNARMQIPIAIFAAEFSIIAYFLKTTAINIDDLFAGMCFGFIVFFIFKAINALYAIWKFEPSKEISLRPLIVFIAYLCVVALFAKWHKAFSSLYIYHLLGFVLCSVLLLFQSIYYFIRASVNYEYKYMPLCDATEKYNSELKEYYSKHDCKTIVSDKMFEYLRDRYIECASVNGANNERRSYFFHKTYIYMIFSCLPICLAVIPFYLGHVNIESDAVQKIEITKIKPKGEYYMPKETEGPKPNTPAPTPPPVRVIKEGEDPKKTNK